MFKVIAIYRSASDDQGKSQLEDYFNKTHTPLCLQVPGIKEVRVNKVFGSPTGPSNIHLVVDMVFESKDSWKAAMKTPQMMSTGQDAMKFAGELVSVHFAEETIVKA
jgi:uncharacterized protein (TIGR02118 family)